MDTAAGVRSAQHAARDIEQTRLVVANEDGGWIVSAACADIPGNLDNAVDYSDVAIERHALAPTLDLLPIAFPVKVVPGMGNESSPRTVISTESKK